MGSRLRGNDEIRKIAGLCSRLWAKAGIQGCEISSFSCGLGVVELDPGLRRDDENGSDFALDALRKGS
jgi:hypothetical protein